MTGGDRARKAIVRLHQWGSQYSRCLRALGKPTADFARWLTRTPSAVYPDPGKSTASPVGGTRTFPAASCGIQHGCPT